MSDTEHVLADHTGINRGPIAWPRIALGLSLWVIAFSPDSNDLWFVSGTNYKSFITLGLQCDHHQHHFKLLDTQLEQNFLKKKRGFLFYLYSVSGSVEAGINHWIRKYVEGDRFLPDFFSTCFLKRPIQEQWINLLFVIAAPSIPKR